MWDVLRRGRSACSCCAMRGIVAGNVERFRREDDTASCLRSSCLLPLRKILAQSHQADSFRQREHISCKERSARLDIPVSTSLSLRKEFGQQAPSQSILKKKNAHLKNPSPDLRPFFPSLTSFSSIGTGATCSSEISPVATRSSIHPFEMAARVSSPTNCEASQYAPREERGKAHVGELERTCEGG